MADLQDLLRSVQSGGTLESAGGFTIDLQQAYQHLARHVFADANEYILKLVQAANLWQTPLTIDLKNETSVIFESWPTEWSLERLAEALVGNSPSPRPGALGLLTMALRGLLGVVPKGLTLRHTVAGLAGRKVLSLGSEITIFNERTLPTKNSRLRLSVPASPALEGAVTGRLLKARCGCSTVPITVDGQPLSATDPLNSLGKHRPKSLSENQVLAQSRWSPYQIFEPAPGAKVPERWAAMRLTVDLDPKATVWFCSTGVLTHQRKLDLRVPGITAVVTADDLPTDLGGFHLRETEELRAVEDWLQKRARRLLDFAIMWLQSDPVRQDRRFAEVTSRLLSYTIEGPP